MTSPVIIPGQRLHLGETTSTNLLLKAAVEQAPVAAWHGTVVSTDYQTAGRGRGEGRSWVCPAGKGLLFSVAIDTSQLSGPGSCLSLLVGVVLAQVLSGYLPRHEVRLKWPNDVYVNGQKLSGILIQETGSWAVVGIGVNVNVTLEDFSSELRSKATSLRILLNQDTDRTNLLEIFLAAFLQEITRVPPWEPVLEQYRRRDYLLGRSVEFEEAGMIYTATACGIAADGALLVRDGHGRQQKLYGGEVLLKVH